MTQYQKTINAVFQAHPQEFKLFGEIHALYEADQKKYQAKFNQLGASILDFLQQAEKTLCGKTERSGMGVYSGKLAEKFWTEVKKSYPLIEFVGAKIS